MTRYELIPLSIAGILIIVGLVYNSENSKQEAINESKAQQYMNETYNSTVKLSDYIDSLRVTNSSGYLAEKQVYVNIYGEYKFDYSFIIFAISALFLFFGIISWGVKEE